MLCFCLCDPKIVSNFAKGKGSQSIAVKCGVPLLSLFSLCFSVVLVISV